VDRKIGISGTREGCTAEQHESFAIMLEHLVNLGGYNELHHGDCQGADEQGHAIATRLNCITVCHPPVSDYMRAYTQNIETREEYGYLQRDHNIVKETDVLVACPKGNEKEHYRSGTWTTVRFARQEGKEIILIWPNGFITQEDSKEQ